MSAADFIEVYPGALSPEACAQVVAYFERSGQATRGKVGSGVDTKLKDSWDVQITGREDWQAFHDAIQGAALRGLLAYLRKYPHTLIAPLSLRRQDPKSGSLVPITAEAIAEMPDGELMSYVAATLRPGSINVQKYIADVGGYPYWHCEHYPRQGSVEPLHRVLLYTIYLNDGFGAGETEFLHQQRKIAPKAGDLLIAPAFFTHTHRGNRPRGRDKYIATSWILFQPWEQIWRAPG